VRRRKTKFVRPGDLKCGGRNDLKKTIRKGGGWGSGGAEGGGVWGMKPVGGGGRPIQKKRPKSGVKGASEDLKDGEGNIGGSRMP